MVHVVVNNQERPNQHKTKRGATRRQGPNDGATFSCRRSTAGNSNPLAYTKQRGCSRRNPCLLPWGDFTIEYASALAVRR